MVEKRMFDGFSAIRWRSILAVACGPGRVRRCLSAYPCAAGMDQWRPAIQWIATERIRTAYASYDAEHYRRLKEHGFNSVICGFGLRPGAVERSQR